MLELSLRTLQRQKKDNLSQILVVPDKPYNSLNNNLQQILDNHTNLPVSLITGGYLKWLGVALNKPSMYHFLQIYYAVKATSAGYLLLHDADLFIAPGDYIEQYYYHIAQSNYAVCGIQRRNGKLQEHYPHTVSTWEMFAKTSWFRSFPPYYFRSQNAILKRKLYKELGTTQLAQAHTNPERVSIFNMQGKYVHLGYAVSAYRRAEQHKQSGIKDPDFSLLSLRILADTVQIDFPKPILPNLGTFLKSLAGRSRYIQYYPRTRQNKFQKFLRNMRLLLELDILNNAEQNYLKEYISAAESAYVSSPDRS